jgi:hypothetical protein
MKSLSPLITLGIILSIGLSQTYDPETGEVIKDKKNSQIQFDPTTGKTISNVQVKSTFQNSFNVRHLAYSDAKDNFNTKLTWSILGGGISLISIPPLAGLGIALGGDELGFVGFIGGVTLAVVGVPKLLAKNESEPSKFVLQQNIISTIPKKEKQEYINIYSKEIEKKRMKAIKKGQIGWALGGLGSIILLTMIFG